MPLAPSILSFEAQKAQIFDKSNYPNQRIRQINDILMQLCFLYWVFSQLSTK